MEMNTFTILVTKVSQHSSKLSTLMPYTTWLRGDSARSVTYSKATGEVTGRYGEDS